MFIYFSACLATTGRVVHAARHSGSASTTHWSHLPQASSQIFRHRVLHRLLDPSRETALRESQRCGDLASSFLSVQCPDCDHHYLLPFTCKRRGCCPSYHQRRALDTATFIRNEVCLPIPHPNATAAATAAEKQIPNSRSAKLASKHERGLLEPY